MTSRAEIAEWFKRGVEKKATHLVVMVDTFSWEDYPVFIEEGQDARNEVTVRNGNNMQNVVEVYNLLLPMDPQLNQHRCFNY
jgi:hypothetical protein